MLDALTPSNPVIHSRKDSTPIQKPDTSYFDSVVKELLEMKTQVEEHLSQVRDQLENLSPIIDTGLPNSTFARRQSTLDHASAGFIDISQAFAAAPPTRQDASDGIAVEEPTQSVSLSLAIQSYRANLMATTDNMSVVFEETASQIS